MYNLDFVFRKVFEVEKLIPHESYTLNGLEQYDIALIKLKTEVSN